MQTRCLDFFVSIPGLGGRSPGRGQPIEVVFVGQAIPYEIGPPTVAVPGHPGRRPAPVATLGTAALGRGGGPRPAGLARFGVPEHARRSAAQGVPRLPRVGRDRGLQPPRREHPAGWRSGRPPRPSAGVRPAGRGAGGLLPRRVRAGGAGGPRRHVGDGGRRPGGVPRAPPPGVRGPRRRAVLRLPGADAAGHQPDPARWRPADHRRCPGQSYGSPDLAGRRRLPVLRPGGRHPAGLRRDRSRHGRRDRHLRAPRGSSARHRAGGTLDRYVVRHRSARPAGAQPRGAGSRSGRGGSSRRRRRRCPARAPPQSARPAAEHLGLARRGRTGGATRLGCLRRRVQPRRRRGGRRSDRRHPEPTGRAGRSSAGCPAPGTAPVTSCTSWSVSTPSTD